MREAERLEKLADAPLVIRDAEASGDRRLQVDTTPAYDAVRLRIRPGLDDLRELGQLRRREPRLRAFAAMIEEPPRPFGIETMHPIAQRLAVHAAHLAAPARSFPSHTAASDSNRRLWLASFDRLASCRNSAAE
jgi:hypothetical protein